MSAKDIWGDLLSLSLSLVSFLFVIYFFNPLNLLTRFYLFLRRKFINFARKFSQKFIKFTQKFTNSRHFFTKFTNSHFYYGLLRRLQRLAMTAWRQIRSFLLAMTANFSQKLKTTAISTPNAFKILKNSTQRNSYE